MHNDQPPEISGIEEIRIVDPDEYVSRHARLHREAGRRTTPLELENWTPKKAARVPRNTEPCPLWVAGLIAVGVGGGALLGAAALGWVVYQAAIWIGGVL